MAKKILLTGASGTVGYFVLKMLVQQGIFDITVFDIETKKSKRLLNKYKSKVNLIYGDISRMDEVKQACFDKDIVIHLAAVIPPLADDEPEIASRVNVIGTKNLVESIEELSPEAFFIYSSSVAIYGDRLKNPDIFTTDTLAPSLGDEYAKTKIKAEEIIQASRLNWTIFRLSAIMGSNNHEVGKLMFHMPLGTAIEICTPEDTARAFVNAVNHSGELNHKIFNLGGGSSCRIIYKDLLSRSFEIFGLGELDFPENTFAEKNFHCGYYADGDKLEEIVHFRQDTMDDYFLRVKENTNCIKKMFTRIFTKRIKRMLQSKSEPFNARKNNEKELIDRFFV